MKIILLGATGMLGRSIVTECIESPLINEILIIGRKSFEPKNDKIKEIIINNFLDYSAVEDQLKGYDACFYCIGVSSINMSKERYYTITYKYTVAIADVLIKHNPEMRLGFVSAAGTDEKEKSRSNWANVRGKAENVLRKYNFKSLSLIRPAYVKAVKGIKPTYTMYLYFGWILYPIFKTLFPKYVITTEEFGKAMINTMYQEEEVRIYESSDIKNLAYIK